MPYYSTSVVFGNILSLVVCTTRQKKLIPPFGLYLTCNKQVITNGKRCLLSFKYFQFSFGNGH